jgi:hypothetical protein
VGLQTDDMIKSQKPPLLLSMSFRRCTSENQNRAIHAEHLLLVNLYKLGCTQQLENAQLRSVATLELSKSLEACNIIPDQNLFAAHIPQIA